MLAEECSCSYHNLYKIEIGQFCKLVCSGERGLSLHMYHSFGCFQKLTDISKNLEVVRDINRHWSVWLFFVWWGSLLRYISSVVG